MRIGIIGGGTMGSALAHRLTRAGHDVIVGSRRPGHRQEGTYLGAVLHGEVTFLALPWPFGLAALAELAPSLSGRILVDVSNPESADGRSLVLGHLTSGAEEIAKVVPSTLVVKAFSHFYSDLLMEHLAFDGGVPSVLYCGDDRRARDVVRELIAGCGYDPVDAGSLAMARYLEPLAMLTVQLVREQGWGPAGVAWRLMRRTSEQG